MINSFMCYIIACFSHQNLALLCFISIQLELRSLGDLQTAGALSIILNRWLPPTSQDCSLVIDSGLSLVELSGTFYLMSVGMGGSVMILLTELAVHHSYRYATKIRVGCKTDSGLPYFHMHSLFGQ